MAEASASSPRTEAATMASLGRRAEPVRPRPNKPFEHLGYRAHCGSAGPPAAPLAPQHARVKERRHPFLQEERVPVHPIAGHVEDLVARIGAEKGTGKSSLSPCGSGPAAATEAAGPGSAARSASSPPTPGSGSGRRVHSNNNGPPAASVAISPVRRRDVGSDQCRSSRARTVGPRERRLVRTKRTAEKVWCCNSAGPIRATYASSGPGGKPSIQANNETGSLSFPNTARRAASRAGRTTASPASRGAPMKRGEELLVSAVGRGRGIGNAAALEPKRGVRNRLPPTP